MMAIIEIYLSTKTDCVLSEKSFDLVDKFRIILLQFVEEQLVVDFKNRTLVKVGTMCTHHSRLQSRHRCGATVV